MNNFVFENSTKVYFGKGVVAEYLPEMAKKYGSKVLMGYGGGSIKENGVYDEVTVERWYENGASFNFSGEEFLVMLKEYGTKKNRLFRMDDKLPIEEYASGIMKECSK